MAHFVQRHACRWAAKWHRGYKIKPDCQWGIPKRNTRTLPRRSLLSKCHTVMRYTRKCYFIFAQKKSVPFPVYVVTKLKHARQHKVQTLCFEYQCHRAINVERSGQALRATGSWGFQDLHRIDTWRWWGCHPYAPAAFTPQEISLVLISVRGWV